MHAPPAPHPSAARRSTLITVGLLAVAALAAYRNTFLAAFVLDDGGSIADNPTIRGSLWRALFPPGAGVTASGRPVLNVTLALNHMISGDAVWSYHALNLVIHFLAACTLFGIVRRTLAGRGISCAVLRPNNLFSVAPAKEDLSSVGSAKEDATPIAFCVALLWLLHPLQTEAVTYVIQRTESLMALFFLLTLYCFIRYADAAGPETGVVDVPADPSPVVAALPGDLATAVPGRPAPAVAGFPGNATPSSHLVSTATGASRPRDYRRTNRRVLAWALAAMMACLLAVGTKEVAATAPLLVFLYDRTFLAGSFREAWRRRRWLHLGLAATWVPLALLVASTGWTRGGTAGFNVGASASAYWCTQFAAITRYLRQSLWPHPQIFDYGTFWMGLRQAAPFAVVVLPALAGTLLALWRWPVIGFLGAWFFVILAPTSVVPGTIQMIVEHRMYLPLAAVLSLAVVGLYAVAGRRSLVAWPVLAVALGLLTAARNQTYRSDLALWRDTVAKVPENARARYSLGIAYSERGQYADAVIEGEAALRLDPTGNYANKAHLVQNKLGYDLSQLGRWPEAVAHYEAALRLDPSYGTAHRNLARALAQLGRYPEAIREYEAAVRLGHDDGPVEAELGAAFMHEGRINEAVGAWRAALRRMPRWAAGYNSLGYGLLLTGHVEESLAAYRTATRLDPHAVAAWVGLGYALVQAGRAAEAIAPCQCAAQLDPGFVDAQTTLGIAYAQSNDPEKAIPCFERALRLNPGAADVHNNLGNALAAVGRHSEALAEYRAALRLDPSYGPARRNLAAELQHAAGGAGPADR